MSELPPSRSPFRKATWPCVVRSSEWVITVAYYSLCIHSLWYVSLIFRHHIHVSEWNKEHNATSPTPPPHSLFPLPLLPSQYLIAFYATNIPCKLLPYHKDQKYVQYVTGQLNTNLGSPRPSTIKEDRVKRHLDYFVQGLGLPKLP